MLLYTMHGPDEIIRGIFRYTSLYYRYVAYNLLVIENFKKHSCFQTVLSKKLFSKVCETLVAYHKNGEGQSGGRCWRKGIKQNQKK